MSNTFEQKIRLIALEDKGEDTAVVKVSDLVALLNSKTTNKDLFETSLTKIKILEARYNSLLAQALQEKPCKCGKYIDLRT